MGLSVSVETLAWIATVAAAAALRFVDLADGELTVSESARSMDAFTVAAGDTPGTWVGDFAASITTYLFDIFGESEVLARLPSAIGGSVLVAALWLARPFAGRSGALVAAGLIALSPLLVLTSRSAEPFAVGGAVAVLAALSLLAYLREPEPAPLFAFVLFAGLAFLTDAVAVSAVLALLLFLAFEGSIVGSDKVQEAWTRFRTSPLQWAIVAIVGAAALQLGLTHFGTSTDKLGLPGITLWSEMFETPRDSRAPEYHLALLLAYEWPILVAGVGGICVLALRIWNYGLGSLSSLERLLLVWVALSSLVIAFSTQREAGQLLILLVPLALLGGVLAERLLRTIDRPAGPGRWTLVAAVLALAAGSALILTEWSSGNADLALKVSAIVFAAIAATLTLFPALIRWRGAGVVAASVLIVLGITFAAHSSFAVSFGTGSEFARDETLRERREPFIQTLNVLAEERSGTVIIDASLQGALGWALRGLPYSFGGPLEEASIFVGLADEPPDGFATASNEWIIAEGWYPQELARPLEMWDWFLFRDPYGEMTQITVQIYVPTV